MPKVILDLTQTQLNQLVISLRNDYTDNDAASKAIISRILTKLGYEV